MHTTPIAPLRIRDWDSPMLPQINGYSRRFLSDDLNASVVFGKGCIAVLFQEPDVVGTRSGLDGFVRRKFAGCDRAARLDGRLRRVHAERSFGAEEVDSVFARFAPTPVGFHAVESFGRSVIAHPIAQCADRNVCVLRQGNAVLADREGLHFVALVFCHDVIASVLAGLFRADALDAGADVDIVSTLEGSGGRRVDTTGTVGLCRHQTKEVRCNGCYESEFEYEKVHGLVCLYSFCRAPNVLVPVDAL
ncbi:unnamed protein product [Pseudo-nitzschia multistriata]|uniref:Uncharacterized protein n=1 Tax=Pseudo-nitzschia multistriata TaxID=183589 RepID=A0A448ZMK8_9STRA|nr:unnamed protein product [Pseudo-nitzschia multistriata]